MTDNLEVIVETLRARIYRLVQSGALAPGDRLPSARTLSREFRVDFRIVLSAYRVLADEQIVVLKPRGGVYLAERVEHRERSVPIPALWIGELLAEGLARDIGPAELHDLIRRCTETLRLRALVVAPTEDQAAGLQRELADDFGLESEALTADSIARGTHDKTAIRRADVLVTVAANLDQVRDLGRTFGIPVLQVRMRPDFASGEWALLLRKPVYAVVATEEFGKMLRNFFGGQPGIENLHVIVHGRDDLSSIPHGAQVYVTQRVRAALSNVDLPGNVLPPARTISSESAREIFSFIVRSNVTAMLSLKNQVD